MVMGSGSVVGEVKDDELTESKIEELEFAGVGASEQRRDARRQQVAPTKCRRLLKVGVQKSLKKYSGLWLAAVLIIVFGYTEPGVFLRISSLKNLGTSDAIIAMIALGLIFPLAGAEFDLSIGYIAGAAGMLSAWLVVSTNMSVWLISL